MTVYQIAEAIGKWPHEVRETLTAGELCELGVYLNSSFSTRSREMLMNGWLVHVVRSIMADKRRPPKFTDSVFPFDKLAKEFFAQAKPKTQSKPPGTTPDVRMTKGEVEHLTQLMRRAREQQIADYNAGRIPNRFGLYINERMKG